MPNPEDRHRISIDVGEELHDKIKTHIPWGLMKPLVVAMLEDFFHLCEQYDSKMLIGAILSEEITLKDFLNKYEKKENDGERR